MPYRKKNDATPGRRERKEWYIRIPTPNHGRIQRSARTTNLATARNYEGMFPALIAQERDAYALIGLVTENKISISDLYQHYVSKTLDGLRAPITPVNETPAIVDLDPLVDGWHEARRTHLAAKTLASYCASVRSMIPAGTEFPISDFTKAAISTWLASHTNASAATQHYHLAGIRHFIKWLQEQDVLTLNPAAGIARPKLAFPRTKHLAPADAIRLAEMQPSPFKEFSAFLNGTGSDVSLARAVLVRDVDHANHEVRIYGGDSGSRKKDWRDRTVRIAEWTWLYVDRQMEGKGPDDLLFDADIIDRYTQWRAHRAAITALVATGHRVYDGYTPRDARHTFAVRLIRAGVPPEVVARQLGHKDAVMVLQVYGRFAPRQNERAYWERHAQAWEKRMLKENTKSSQRSLERARDREV